MHLLADTGGGESCMFVKTSITAKQITNLEHLNFEEHFEASIVKLIHFKLVICLYRNPTGNIQILLNNLDTILGYFDKKNDEIIIIGDLNINFLKNYCSKKSLEVLLNVFGLQVVINVLTRIIKEAKSAIDQIILNTQLWGFNRKYFKELYQIILDRYFN
jgi:hypothetical protein